MLSRLAIRNYALIDDLNISFGRGLNILTGETGAGKSIILGALSLILGQRTESRYFFNQQKKCIIEAVFTIGEYKLEPFFLENDLDFEQETVVRREISADGRSRAFINDSPVNLTVLKQLGEQLIDIHSQHATLEINDEGFQLVVVDTLAAHPVLLAKYQETYKLYRSTLTQLNRLTEESRQSQADADYFRFQFDELERAALTNGEQEKLEQELARLSHAEEIKRNLSGANRLLADGEPDLLSQLKESITLLQQAKKYAVELGGLEERLQSAWIEIKDISAEIEHLDQQIIVDEGRSDIVGSRLDTIYTLQKKHRVQSIAELIIVQDDLSEKLVSLGNTDDEIEKLTLQRSRLHLELTALSDQLSASRNEVIPGIEQKTAAILAGVGMPNAVLKIENTLLPVDQFNSTGRNVIRFLFSANKGQDPAPMNRIASGGELSRLMLSIKSLISRHTALPTIIFDEIDTGISGETALKVGAIMEKLSEGMQVIAITHLPQIASRGTEHYSVYKEETGDKTLTRIRLLRPEERVVEIATMLSGANPGAFALQNARELLGYS